MKAAQGNTAAFLDFLENILIAYRTQLIQLWVDNASWHKGDRVMTFLKNHTRLKLFYHPPYHPELNCQETVWKRIRYEITTNCYREKIEHLEQAIFSRVKEWSNEKVKSFSVAKCKLI